MRVSWQGEEREEIRPGMQPSQNWFFSLLSCKLLFLPTCLWNVLFFKVNRCLQKLLKYFRSSFGTWFQISSAIWNPRSYLNLRLKFRSSVWRRPFNACGNTGVRLTLSWGAPASYWRARLLWFLWQKEDLQKKITTTGEVRDTSYQPMLKSIRNGLQRLCWSLKRGHLLILLFPNGTVNMGSDSWCRRLYSMRKV